MIIYDWKLKNICQLGFLIRQLYITFANLAISIDIMLQLFVLIKY